jgi:diguanylate cyclase (GGDEF)-like protein
MFNPFSVIAVICIYIGLLFCIALWVERKASSGKNIGNNPLVYSLSLAVYCTTWTYYGSVGNAATSGMLFLTIYLGPTLAIILWWTFGRKIIRIKNAYRITSIADFISVRYNKSQTIAAIATIIALFGMIPYVALQLKAVISTFGILIKPSSSVITSWAGQHICPLVVVLMTIFTIIFGVRKLDPTERHQGMVVALAVECTIKLIALRVKASHDPLTGLWYHEEILRILERDLVRAEREGTCVGLLMADLDHFKNVNDTFGHMAGDVVLRVVAKRMLSSIRPYDAVGRYGGEEFVVVLPGCEGVCPEAIAERFRKSIESHSIDAPEGLIPITISLGTAISCKEKRRDVNSLVRAADAALYRAKKNGRNRFEVAMDDE